MSPEQFAALPPDAQEEFGRAVIAELQRRGVGLAVTPQGQMVVDLVSLAPALGMSIAECQELLDESGMQGTDRDDLETLH
jgi:hypothetical protein